MSALDKIIYKLNHGEQIAWQFISSKDKKILLNFFDGEKNFRWFYSDFTYISLKDTKQKISI